MKSMTQRISGSVRASGVAATGAGKLLSMMVSPLTPALTRTRCQISSLMNGASGCSARSSASSVWIKVWRVPRFSASLAVSENSRAFDSSRYQSQYSCQVNS